MLKLNMSTNKLTKKQRIQANRLAVSNLTSGDIDKTALLAYTGLGGVGVSNTQYWTPDCLTKFIWHLLRKTGVSTGSILEPSCGSGAFFKTKPFSYILTGVEIDATAATVASSLYNTSTIHNTSFEHYILQAMSNQTRHHAIIGNIPFGRRGKNIATDNKYSTYRYHEQYFLIRSLNLLPDNGIIALICPTSILDNQSNLDFRKELFSKASLLGAYRFGSETFKSAGACVVTDLIILRKTPETNPTLKESILSGNYFSKQGLKNILGKTGYSDRWGKPTVIGQPTQEDLNTALLAFNPTRIAPVIDEKATMVSPLDILPPSVEEAIKTGRAVHAFISARNKGADITSIRTDAAKAVRYYLQIWGNPSRLSSLAGQHKEIAHLIAAVNEDGSLSDIFRKQNTQVETNVLTDAYKLVRSNIHGTFTLNELHSADEAALLADPAFALTEDGSYTTIENYLSGSLYSKIDALTALLVTADPVKKTKYEYQLTRLKQSLRITTLDDAHVSLRDGWISDAIKNEYLTFVDAKSKWGGYGNLAWDVEKNEYIVGNQQAGNLRMPIAPYGNAKLLYQYLNHRGLGGRDDSRLQNIAQMQLLDDTFKDWVLISEHRDQLEDTYNRLFNGYVAPEYNLDPMVIPHFNFSLHGYQYQSIRKMIFQGKGINALDVGLGKTLMAIALCLKMKADGRITKPMIVVPKSVLANWKAEIERSTYDIKVLYIGEKFKAGGKSATMTLPEREVALKQAMQNDWDLIVISDSAFQQVPLSPEIMQQYSDEEFYNDTYGIKLTDYKKAKLLNDHERVVSEREFLNVSNQTFFDDLGIDYLVADELQLYKNMAGSKQQSRIRYLPTGDGAKRSYDFNSKARFILDRYNNMGIVGLTATPTKNSPLEIYHQISHIAPEEWTQRGIYNIEHFIDHYGDIETRAVLKTSGEYEEVQCLVGFKNLNSLRDILFKYTDLKSADEVGLVLPESESNITLSDLNKDQLADYDDLRLRALTLAKEKTCEDHIFSIMHDMETVAFAPQLYDAEKYPEDYISPKIKTVCESVMAQINAGAGGQIIFTTDKFVSVHALIKQALVDLGVPADVIGIINGTTAKKSSDRLALSNKFNQGILKVIIGNDGIIGQGVNLQEDTSGIHHATLPWTPADLIQRNGRGLRQGNQQDLVKINTYFSKGSFDCIRHEALNRKANWIGELWRGKSETYINLDADTKGGIDPSELHILLSPDPEAARQMYSADKEVAKQAYINKKTVDMYRLYLQLEKRKKLLAVIDVDTVKHTMLSKKIADITKWLDKSEYFTHKHLLTDDGYGSINKGVFISRELSRVFVTNDYIKTSIMYASGEVRSSYFKISHAAPDRGYLRVDPIPYASMGYSEREWSAKDLYRHNAYVVNMTHDEIIAEVEASKAVVVV